MISLPLDRARWPAVALAASAAMLATAHGFEFFGYAPCEMCHWQRWVYWASGWIGVLGLLAAWRAVNPHMLLAINVLLGLAFATGFGIAFWHAGVEWKYFPGPPTCSAGSFNLNGQKLSDLISRPIHVPSCGDATWRFPTMRWGLSMAGFNTIISLGLAVASFVAAFRTGPNVQRSDTANETSPPLETIEAVSTPERGAA